MTTGNAISAEQMPKPARQTAGLLVDDLAFRRLESILTNLELETTVLDRSVNGTETATNLRRSLPTKPRRESSVLCSKKSKAGETIKPALVAIVPTAYAAKLHQIDNEDFDTALALPERPAVLNAQLGVALYAHRAIAQRYQSALEELEP